MATQPFETMAWPVVPAGMSFVATTADVVVEATVFVPAFVLFEAPRTLAYAMTEPATKRMAAITTSMSVCFFTDRSPLSQPGNNARMTCAVPRWFGLHGTTEE